MATTLQEVFLRYFSVYAESHRMPLHFHQAAKAIMECRTAALGGHLQACPEGHVERIWYNSCRHRACPQCNGLQLERWLADQKARLLACDHFHVVFTISDLLHPLWWANPKEMANLLFRCARDTLFELLDDPKFMGARPGLISSLHTWTRTQYEHPHLHCLVSGGGLTKGGEWRAASEGFLLPFRKARKEFRDRYLAAIRRSFGRGDMVLPRNWSRAKLDSVLDKAGRKKWNVHFVERYEHGNGLLAYLARYIRGGPISNRRLNSIDDGSVTFWYVDNADGKSKTMTLSADEFIRRVLQHVPAPGFQVVRHCGLYARQKRSDLDRARQQLGQAPQEKPARITCKEYFTRLGISDPNRCPVCGQRLIVRRQIPRGGAPPGLQGLKDAA